MEKTAIKNICQNCLYSGNQGVCPNCQMLMEAECQGCHQAESNCACSNKDS